MKKLSKKKKQQIRRGVALVIAGGIIAAAFLGIVFTVAGFVKNRYFSDDPVVDYGKVHVEKPEITVDLLTPNSNSRPQTALEEVRGIVVHYTANPGTGAQANRDYFESRKKEPDTMQNKVSSHFIIGLEGEIIQCIPLNEIAYASNDRNQDTISIECCHPDQSGKFRKKTYQSLVSLCTWLCDRYEIADRTEIIRHYDVTGKLCPLYYVKHPSKWKAFQREVWNRLVEAQYGERPEEE